MRTAISILQKVLVNHFYRVNAALFLFLFFVLFGLPYDVGGFHIAIATIIVKNPLFLLIIMAIWLLYSLKCIDYTVKQIREPQQQFLFCLHNKGFKTCFLLLSYVQFFIYVPVLAYAIFIIIIAFKNHAYLCIAEIMVFTLAILSITPLLYVKILQRVFTGVTLSFLKPVSIPVAKTFSTIPLLYIWHSRKQMLFITKIFSLFALFIFFKTYAPDHYDVRPVLLCFMLSTAANSTIVFEIHNFENMHLQFYKSFPFTVIKRFAYILLMYTLLLLPELVFVWKGFPVFFHSTDYLQIVLLGVSLLCLFYVSLLTDTIVMETYTRIIIGALLFLYFVILYSPGILLPIIMLLIAFGLFKAYYYDYEKKEAYK